MYTWGIVGSDLIAEDFIETLLQHHHTCKVALCTNNKIKEEYPKLEYYETVDEMLHDESIQVIYISTHAHQHRDIMMCALKAGKHVIGEKPMFLCAEDAKAAYQYAAQHNLLLGEANTIYYMPIYKEILKRIELQDIGNLKMIRCDFGSLKEEDLTAPVFQKEKAGGALYDIGIYALTAVLQILGTKVEVQACAIPHYSGVDEGWSIMLKNDSDQLAAITLSLRSKLSKRLLIAGDKGFIEMMNYPRGDRYDFTDPDMHRATITNGVTNDAVWYEIEKVETMIENKDYNGCMADLNYHVMKVMDQIREELAVC